MNTALLSEIDRFLAATGMGEDRFGFVAVKNTRLVKRLRSGGRVWPETEQQVRAFIIANSHESSRRPKGLRARQTEAA